MRTRMAPLATMMSYERSTNRVRFVGEVTGGRPLEDALSARVASMVAVLSCAATSRQTPPRRTRTYGQERLA